MSKIKVSVFEDIDLKKASEKSFEFHKRHVDLFTVIEGEMFIDAPEQAIYDEKSQTLLISSTYKYKELSYDETKDFGKCEIGDQETSRFQIPANSSFKIDSRVPHKPCLGEGKCTFTVTKIEV